MKKKRNSKDENEGKAVVGWALLCDGSVTMADNLRTAWPWAGTMTGIIFSEG